MSSVSPPSATCHHEVVADPRTALTAAAVAFRSPQGHLRVVDAVSAGPAAQPYLDARAKVIRVDRKGGVLGSYHAVLEDADSLVPDDVDVVLWDGEGDCDPRWLVSRLAAGGIFVVPRGVVPRLVGLGLRLESGGSSDIAVAFDPRPLPDLPEALAQLDRTMCVDRTLSLIHI